jgi:hypothetical protein
LLYIVIDVNKLNVCYGTVVSGLEELSVRFDVASTGIDKLNETLSAMLHSACDISSLTV